jgi:uncharacterized protein (DUF362 family)
MRRGRLIIYMTILLLAFPLCVAAVMRLLSAGSMVAAEPRSQSGSTVAIARSTQPPTSQSIEAAVRDAVASALGGDGLAQLIRPGATCLLKPNLGLGLDEHEITSWQVVRAVALLCQEAGAGRVLIGESPERGLNHYAQAGYTTNIPNVEFIDFSALSTPLVSVSVADSLWPYGEPLVLPRAYMEADVVISIPKLKTHSTAGMTGALKNAVGVPPIGVYATSPTLGWRDRFHREYGIHKTIAQINLARQPDLVIMDAILAGEGMGPWGADPVDLGLVLASTDPVAIDAVASAIMGFEPDRVRHLVYAQGRGLGEAELSKMEVVGHQIGDVARAFKLPGREHTLYRKTVILRPPPASMVIDGDISEWGDRTWLRIEDSGQICQVGLPSGEFGPVRFEAVAAYDNENLYLAARVWDDVLIPGSLSPSGVWTGDAFEICFSGADQDEPGRRPEYLAVDKRIGLAYGQENVVMLPSGAPVADAIARVRQTNDGYTLEAAIPFRSLGGYRPTLHGEIGLDFAVVDVDQVGGPLRRLIWSGSCAVLTDPCEMGVALLAAAQEVPTPTPTQTMAPTHTSTALPTQTMTPTSIPTRPTDTPTALPTQTVAPTSTPVPSTNTPTHPTTTPTTLPTQTVVLTGTPTRVPLHSFYLPLLLNP